MLFRKLWAAMLAQQLLPELLPICEGTQFGTSVANGSATMVASMASALLEDEELCFLQLDIHNAFSALDRAVLLRTLEAHGGEGYQKHKQAVRALVRAPICVLAPCQLAEVAPSGVFRSYEGLPQGDPCSSLLFCSIMAIALRQALAAAAVEGCPTAVAYVDDAILMTKAADLLATHQAVQQSFSTLGLSMQHRKTRLWAPGVSDRQRQFLADNLECQLAENGLLVCGQPLCPHPFEEDFVPLGDDSFIQEQLAKILRSFDADLQRLRHLATMWPETVGHQLLCILVRNMFPSRVLHLLRAVPHVHIMPFWEQVQQLLRAVLADMLRVPTIPAQSWTLLNMP